jgi:DNA-binding NtrC family response regulator
MGSKQAKILCAEANEQVLAAQVKMFEKAGYTVVPALGRAAIEAAVSGTSFDLVILGHTLHKDDRHHLPYMAKKANPETRVLVLHASGKHPKVDIALDSRVGDTAVLRAAAELTAREPRKVPAAAAVAPAFA